MRALTSHAWPGNVRELRNVIERAVLMTRTPDIAVEDLPESIFADPSAANRGPEIVLHVGCTIEQAEKEIIRKTLEAAGDNKTKAAKILDISLKTLHNKLNEYGLRERKSGEPS
jgi:DNA-binding NtrC family response regulator